MGKTRFADALQVALARAGVESFRASADDFHRPQAFRYRQGRDSPKGYYEDAFDTELLDRVLLHPFRMGGSTGFMTRAFDLHADRSVEMEWETAGPDAVLLVDGDKVTTDVDALAKITVTAEVVTDLRGPKIRIQHYRNKTGYKRRMGHRSELTRLKVTEIK